MDQPAASCPAHERSALSNDCHCLLACLPASALGPSASGGGGGAAGSERSSSPIWGLRSGAIPRKYTKNSSRTKRVDRSTARTGKRFQTRLVRATRVQRASRGDQCKINKLPFLRGQKNVRLAFRTGLFAVLWDL